MSSASVRRDTAIQALDAKNITDYEPLAKQRLAEAAGLLKELGKAFPPEVTYFKLEELAYPIVALRRKFEKGSAMHNELTNTLKQMLETLKELETTIYEQNPQSIPTDDRGAVIEEELSEDPTLPGGKRRKTRRKFKMPRRMSRKYCKKTPCKKMGFTQRASCRPWKNCYRKKK